MIDEESDNEERDESLNREVLADHLFVNSDEVIRITESTFKHIFSMCHVNISHFCLLHV